MTMTTSTEQADVCVVGLGYVGLTLATAFAVAGLRVAGVERNPSVVAEIAAGRSPFHETGLDDAVTKVVASGLLTAVGLDAPLPPAAAYVITVGTPVRDGQVFLGDLESAVRRVATDMPDGALVVLRSTVRVGTTNGIAAEVLRESGTSFSLAMAPERTIEGKALAELSSLPQIVGGIDERSTELAAALFGRLGVEIVRVESAEAAELAKLASNTYRDLQFAYANELAYLADTIGIDVFDVITACNHGYERMNVAKPGPVAGPCLEKDAYILANSAELHGTHAPLVMTARRTNEAITEHVVTMVADLPTPDRVAILGLAFKGRPETSDVRGSMARDFADAVVQRWSGTSVVGWDPLVSVEDAASLGVTFGDAADVIAGSPLIIVQTNHPTFGTPEFARLLIEHAPSGAVIVDLWNQLDAAAHEHPELTVRAFGRMNAAVVRVVEAV